MLVLVPVLVLLLLALMLALPPPLATSGGNLAMRLSLGGREKKRTVRPMGLIRL